MEIYSYSLTEHAKQEMQRRGISMVIVDSVMTKPQQIIETHTWRKVYQSKMMMNGKLYLIRAIVEEHEPLTVVTVYRTSKVAKYWSDNYESNV